MALIITTENSCNKLDEWIIESGCSNHMKRDKKEPILNIAHIGEVSFSSSNNKKEPILKGVYHVPSRKLEDPTMYIKIVGNLIYLTLIRPDIAFIVGVLSRYMQTPRKPQLDAIRRVIRYVKTTLSYGVFFKRDSECKLPRYCDAEYEGDVNTQ
ncbi:secreted RxLR effector protein 161-like [Lactuca sativa]|uniref:secreted RxLR effector protein 161-like n=1 Tax=Lactuca sativa TaxID=4236 RepID=UPI001C68AC9F|nr:secreted RxLR effector protein 161-like [Lactuca sativa]